MSYCTINPHADAENWEDDQEAKAEREEAHRLVLANEFLDAARWGNNEPIHGSTVIDRLAELAVEHPSAMCRLLTTAALSKDPAVRAAVETVADTYVEYFRSLLPDAP